MPLRYNYDKPEKPRISRVFGYLARFFHPFPNRKIEPRSSYIVGGVIVTTKTKYRLGGLSTRPRNQDISSEKKKCPFFVPKIRCRQEEHNAGKNSAEGTGQKARAIQKAETAAGSSRSDSALRAASIPGSSLSGAGGCVHAGNRRKR